MYVQKDEAFYTGGALDQTTRNNPNVFEEA